MLIHVSCVNFGMDKNKKNHIRYGFAPEYREYKFNNTKNNDELIDSFSNSDLMDVPTNDILSKCHIEYSIFTSIEEAEIAAVERMELSSVYYLNSIDFPLDEYEIGDNCWHFLEVGVIMFTRNNVLVLIYPEFANRDLDSSEVKHAAYSIDSILYGKNTVTDASLIYDPKIESSELLSEPPIKLEDMIEIKVTVNKESEQTSYFRINGMGLSSISNDGHFNFKIDESLLYEKNEKKYIRIWIWNEEFKKTSTLIEIPL